MEMGDTKTILKASKHPYTFGLLKSLPRIEEKIQSLYSIPGDVPDMLEPPSGCPFHPRCAYAIINCQDKVPALEEYEKGHLVACVRANEF
jgi:peptide/nickel transport system ATP-binding protein